MKKFDVVYEREPDGRWVVRVPEVQGCHSYGRTIEQARTRIREALALFVPERTAAAAEFHETFELPRGVLKDLDVLREMKMQLIQRKLEMAKIERRVLKSLREDVRLGQRDAGELLGVSFQRVHQLEAAADDGDATRARVHGAKNVKLVQPGERFTIAKHSR